MLSKTSIERNLACNFAAWFFFLGLLALVGSLHLAVAWVVTVVLVALAVTTPLTLALSRSITTPIRSMTNAATDLSRGKLSVVLEDRQRQNDEIGELNGRFRAIAEYLEEMAGLSSAIANGDLTVQTKPHCDDDVLSHAFRRMTEGLVGIVRSVRSAATQVASGADQVAGATRETEQASSQLSTAIDDLASAMAEMSANVKSISRNAQAQAGSVAQTSHAIERIASGFLSVATNVMLLCDMSDRSHEEVRAGIAAAARANEGLKDINTSISSTAQIVAALGNRADSIGNIVEVIDDIAEQTNLLALNAAIEAARAGDHGLGFAVVADEIRKLAEKSAQSTKEINTLIRSIQEEARRAVQNMERSTATVDDGMKTGSELTHALEKIGQVVTEFNRLAQEVGTATSEQSDVSVRIERATSQLNEITHEINSAVQEQADGTESAVRSLDRMRDMMQRFRAGTVQLAATAEQMTRMSRLTLDAVEGFTLRDAGSSAPVYRLPVAGRKAARAAVL
jgi:methyl-accepting chemotaxis protein